MNNTVKFSIRMKLMIILLIVTAGTCLAYILMNQFFMKDYYISVKKDNLIKVYEKVSELVNNDNNISRDTSGKIANECELYGASLIVVDNSETIKFLYGNDNMLRYRLRDIDFGINPPDYNIVERNENYTLAEVNIDNQNSYDGTYLELSGFFDSENIFLIRMSVENISESVALSLSFFARIGVVISLIGIIAAFLIARQFTKPIMKLANISKEMSKLKFDTKYSGTSDDEIGVLGNTMNELSDKLKSTIDELKSANEKLQKDIEKKNEIDEMRKEFISNVSHELKTPIALIQGYAEGLAECVNDDDDESREFYCSVITDEADKMNKMVKSLLSLTKLEFGNEVLDLEKFDITMVIRGVIESLDYMIKQNNIKMNFECDEEILVRADEFKIEEVITNYLTNAIHYAGEDKMIRVSIEKTEKIVRVSVFNSGENIPESELENIWVKFYKVDKARTREYGGSGIGLSIVKAIMNAHNMEYGVKNTQNGVVFYFDIEMA